MIVVCINEDNWVNCRSQTRWTGWKPLKDCLYEVIKEIHINNELYYLLRECPAPDIVFYHKCFREVDIDIKDIECEIVEEVAL